MDNDLVAVFTAEHQVRRAGDNAENLMRGGVVVVVVIDSVAPLRRPSIAGKKLLVHGRWIRTLRLDDASVKQHGQMLVVGHPAVPWEWENLRFGPGIGSTP